MAGAGAAFSPPCEFEIFVLEEAVEQGDELAHHGPYREAFDHFSGVCDVRVLKAGGG